MNFQEKAEQVVAGIKQRPEMLAVFEANGIDWENGIRKIFLPDKSEAKIELDLWTKKRIQCRKRYNRRKK